MRRSRLWLQSSFVRRRQYVRKRTRPFSATFGPRRVGFAGLQRHDRGNALMSWNLFGFVIFGGSALVVSLAALAWYCIWYIAKW